MRIFHEPDLSSTNTVLKARIEARQYRRFPMALTAETQTAGRGVGRNVWCSDKGANALFSLAF
ncbi:MAG: biotin--[acetyl-CoA-carboxylase] ligase, partial [Bacteroidales bacterium]|nr:biotin--[acetyl-CoA-carboxylase] ligase [Bacteroidales bacterium]